MKNQITTAEQPVSKAKLEIMKESKRIEESSLYSAKGHFAAAHTWANFHLIIGVPIVVLAAIAGSSFISNNNVIAGVLSLIIAVLSAVMTFLNPNERSSSHLNAGNSYDTLQNEVRIFRTIDCWREDSEQILTERLKHYSDQKGKLSQSSPQIPWWAYQIAKRGIKAGEGSYEVDKDDSSMKIADQIPKRERLESTDKPTDVENTK
ncbi:MAG: SLATT domain-containing protein [Candidatus Omnitrophica bacterium]|nr:SLATT domain-containing protein [Candidatus Omnitrophota bacterium]